MRLVKTLARRGMLELPVGVDRWSQAAIRRVIRDAFGAATTAQRQLIHESRLLFEVLTPEGYVRPWQCAVGCGDHRSGWPWVLRGLQERLTPSLLLDDFVEQTFIYGKPARHYERPWVGIFHHPPQMPDFSLLPERLSTLVQCERFRASLPHLRLAVVLSQALGDYLQQRLNVPVLVLRHPTEFVERTWRMTEFLGRPRLVQVGHYQRNTRAVYQVAPIDDLERCRLYPQRYDWQSSWDKACQAYWCQLGTRPEFPGVVELPIATPAQYDEILATSIVITELLAASANNVVVECIARSTPIIVNRCPQTVEYLGRDYPLFFSRISEVPSLLADYGRVSAAHQYLLGMDKRPLSIETFSKQLEAGVSRVA